MILSSDAERLDIFFIVKIMCVENLKQLQRRHEQMRRSLEQQVRELEEKRRAFEAEKTAWEQQTGHSIEELRRRSLEANSKE